MQKESRSPPNKSLRFIELRLWLLATRTLPIVGQVFKGYAVMLCGVINIAANGTDVLARSLLLGEVDFSQNGRHRIIQVHHALGLKIFISLRRVSTAIDRGVVADKLADTVLYFSISRSPLAADGRDDGTLLLQFGERLVHHFAVEAGDFSDFTRIDRLTDFAHSFQYLFFCFHFFCCLLILGKLILFSQFGLLFRRHRSDIGFPSWAEVDMPTPEAAYQ